MPDIRGLKRTCASCATRFYDFNKSPVICPKCKTEFTGTVKIRTRRSRNVIEDAKAKAAESDDTIEIVADDETVSLEDLEKEEKGVKPGADDDDDIDLDIDEDDDDDLDDLEEDIEVEKE